MRALLQTGVVCRSYNVPGVLPKPGHYIPPDWAKAGLFPAARNYVDPAFTAGSESSGRFAAPGVFWVSHSKGFLGRGGGVTQRAVVMN